MSPWWREVTVRGGRVGQQYLKSRRQPIERKGGISREAKACWRGARCLVEPR